MTFFAGWGPGQRAAGVFGSAMVLFYLSWGPISQVDAIPAPYAAWSLVRHGTLELQHYPYLDQFRGGMAVELDDGRTVSKFPPGSSLFAVPIVLPRALASETPPGPSAMRRMGKLVGALTTAAAVAVFYLVCLRLAPGGAVFASVVLAAGTTLWPVASQALWAHGPATLCVSLVMWLLLCRGDGERQGLHDLVSGGLLGLAMVTRPTTAIFAVATLAGLVWNGQLNRAVRIGAVAAVPVAAMALYHLRLHGSALLGGYVHEGNAWTTPFFYGAFGLLVSPSRGLLVYTPALLLAPWGLARVLGSGAQAPPVETRRLLVVWLAAFVATVAMYAPWHLWWGGWCYGPRFLCESLPVLCLLLALAWESGTPLRRRCAVGLAVISVAIQALGVVTKDADRWNARHSAGPRFTLRDTQIGSALRYLVSWDVAEADRG